jgi:predicted MFS family arabinose efflux permease
MLMLTECSGLTAIATFVVTDFVPLRRRGVWQGFGNICFGTGSALGGVFGGFLHDTLGWRWAFLIQVPLVVVSGALVFFFTSGIPVKESHKSRISRVDFLGALTLVIMLVLLLLGLNSGGNLVPWNHPLVIVSLILGFVFFLVFIYVEDRIAPEPVIPVRLLLDRTVFASCLINWLMCMSVFSLIYFGPIYFQALGASATVAGLRMIPQSAGAAIGSLGSGLIMRATGRYWLLVLALNALGVLGNALILATFNRTTALAPSLVYIILNGIWYGGMLTCTLVGLIAAVDHEQQAVVTSASYAFRSTGSTIGITAASTVFQNVLRKQLWQRLGDRKGAAEVIKKVRDSINEVANLKPGWKEEVLESYVQALKGVWGLMLALSVAVLICGLFMKEHILHKNLARTPAPAE